MEVEWSESITPTPAGKGKDKQPPTGQAEIRQSINEYLQTLGPTKGTPVVMMVGNLTDKDLTEEGMTTMTLILSLAHQVHTLTANVQNLTLLIRDQNTTTGNVKAPKADNEKNPSQAKPEAQVDTKSYAEAITANDQDLNTQTPRRRSRKRKGSASPIPSQPLLSKVPKGGKDNKKAKEELPEWKIVGASKLKETKIAKCKLFAMQGTATSLTDPSREEA